MPPPLFPICFAMLFLSWCWLIIFEYTLQYSSVLPKLVLNLCIFVFIAIVMRINTVSVLDPMAGILDLARNLLRTIIIIILKSMLDDLERPPISVGICGNALV